MPKILMPIGDASETLDTFYAYYRLPEDGLEVIVAGPEARLYHTVLHEIPPNPEVPWDITQERPGYHLRATAAFRELRADDFAGMFISGGRAPEYLRYDKDLLRLTREICGAGKPIACLCHGIEILSAADCIRGKRVTTVPKCALDAAQGGATYVAEPVVVDGSLVTARGYQDNTALLRQFIRLLRQQSNRGDRSTSET
jgi:protease I